MLAFRPAIPAAAAFAEYDISIVGHGQGILKLDEAATRMFECRFDRNYHSCFERTFRVEVLIWNRPVGGETGRLMADKSHAMSKEFQVVALLRLLQQFLGRGVYIATHPAWPDRYKSGTLYRFDFGEKFL